MNAIGIVAGDGVRVGLEDNIWYDEQRTVLANQRRAGGKNRYHSAGSRTWDCLGTGSKENAEFVDEPGYENNLLWSICIINALRP